MSWSCPEPEAHLPLEIGWETGGSRGGLVESPPSRASRCTLISHSSEPLELSSLEKWTQTGSGFQDTRYIWRRQAGICLKTAWGEILHLPWWDHLVPFHTQLSETYWPVSTLDALPREETEGILSGETHQFKGKDPQELSFGLDRCLTAHPGSPLVHKTHPCPQSLWSTFLCKDDHPFGKHLLMGKKNLEKKRDNAASRRKLLKYNSKPQREKILHLWNKNIERCYKKGTFTEHRRALKYYMHNSRNENIKEKNER